MEILQDQILYHLAYNLKRNHEKMRIKIEVNSRGKPAKKKTVDKMNLALKEGGCLT